MGCASSSPVVNNGEGGGAMQTATENMPGGGGDAMESMADKAKSATNSVIEAGEKVLNGKDKARAEDEVRPCGVEQSGTITQQLFLVRTRTNKCPIGMCTARNSRGECFRRRSICIF